MAKLPTGNEIRMPQAPRINPAPSTAGAQALGNAQRNFLGQALNLAGTVAGIAEEIRRERTVTEYNSAMAKVVDWAEKFKAEAKLNPTFKESEEEGALSPNKYFNNYQEFVSQKDSLIEDLNDQFSSEEAKKEFQTWAEDYLQKQGMDVQYNIDLPANKMLSYDQMKENLDLFIEHGKADLVTQTVDQAEALGIVDPLQKDELLDNAFSDMTARSIYRQALSMDYEQGMKFLADSENYKYQTWNGEERQIDTGRQDALIRKYRSDYQIAMSAEQQRRAELNRQLNEQAQRELRSGTLTSQRLQSKDYEGMEWQSRERWISAVQAMEETTTDNAEADHLNELAQRYYRAGQLNIGMIQGENFAKMRWKDREYWINKLEADSEEARKAIEDRKKNQDDWEKEQAEIFKQTVREMIWTGEEEDTVTDTIIQGMRKGYVDSDAAKTLVNDNYGRKQDPVLQRVPGVVKSYVDEGFISEAEAARIERDFYDTFYKNQLTDEGVLDVNRWKPDEVINHLQNMIKPVALKRVGTVVQNHWYRENQQLNWEEEAQQRVSEGKLTGLIDSDKIQQAYRAGLTEWDDINNLFMAGKNKDDMTERERRVLENNVNITRLLVEHSALFSDATGIDRDRLINRTYIQDTGNPVFKDLDDNYWTILIRDNDETWHKRELNTGTGRWEWIPRNITFEHIPPKPPEPYKTNQEVLTQ